MNENNQYLELLYSLFNQYIFQEAKNNLPSLKYYYQTNPTTSNNPLVNNMLQAIEDYPLESIDYPLFQSILNRTGKNGEESRAILEKVSQYKRYDKSQIAPTRGYIKDIVANVIISQAANKYRDRPSEYLNYLKTAEFKATEEDYLNSTAFNQVDMNTIIAESSDSSIESSFDWINQSYQPEQGYPKGQMVMISMSPGSGKSLMLANEAIYMANCGHKVHLLIMGDLGWKDQIIRMCAIWSGKTFGEVKMNLPYYYKGLASEIEDRLEMTIVPAGKITAEEYVDFIKTKDYDVLGIDYDSNFKVETRDNMYDAWGSVYESLTELTLLGKLVFILAQPKISSWQQEAIYISQVGESAKKQMTVDCLITRGRVEECPLPLGQTRIVKNRRGEVNVIDYNIRLNNGRFKSLPKSVYDNLKQITEKREFTEAEIDQMVNSANQVSQNIQRDINNKINNSQRIPPGPRPF